MSYLFPLAMNHLYLYKIVFKNHLGDFPSGPVVKTLCSHTIGYRLAPWSGSKIPHASWLKHAHTHTHTHTHRVLTDCAFEYSYSQTLFKYFLIFIKSSCFSFCLVHLTVHLILQQYPCIKIFTLHWLIFASEIHKNRISEEKA